MIRVFANVSFRAGCLQQALDCYRFLVPAVLSREAGCLEYAPLVDLDLNLHNQDKDEASILVSECWQSVADFKAHLAMDHCVVFRGMIAPYLSRGIRIRVMQEAAGVTCVSVDVLHKMGGIASPDQGEE